MNRKKKRAGAASRKPGLPATSTGVAADELPALPVSSRRGAGRLGRALRVSRKKKGNGARSESSPEAKSPALIRWESEGGRPGNSASGAASKDASNGGASTRSAKRGDKSQGQPKKGLKSASAAAQKRPPASSDSRLNTARQRRAETAAKRARIKRTGLTSRVLGHVSARGKRAQARRDSKN